MKFRISDSIMLSVEPCDGDGYKEVSIDIIRNGEHAPLLLIENYTDESEDVIHVYLYNETDDDPAEFMYDTNMDEYLQLAERHI